MRPKKDQVFGPFSCSDFSLMIPRKVNNNKEAPAFSHAFAAPVRQKYLHVQADPEMSDTRIGKSLMLLVFFLVFFSGFISTVFIFDKP